MAQYRTDHPRFGLGHHGLASLTNRRDDLQDLSVGVEEVLVDNLYLSGTKVDACILVKVVAVNLYGSAAELRALVRTQEADIWRGQLWLNIGVGVGGTRPSGFRTLTVTCPGS